MTYDISFYQINTGKIYSMMEDSNINFNEELVSEIEKYIAIIQEQKSIIHDFYDDDSEIYFQRCENELDVRYKYNYAFKRKYIREYKYIIHYYTDCIINIEDDFFYVFFGVRFLLLEDSEIKTFLEYHIENTFAKSYNFCFEYLNRFEMFYSQYSEDIFNKIKQAYQCLDFKKTFTNNINVINTGFIYQEMQQSDVVYPDGFIEKVEFGIFKLKSKYKQYAIKYNEKDQSQFLKYRTRIYNKPTDAKYSFYGISEFEFIIDYNSPFIIDKSENEFEFELFFAIELSLKDVKEIKDFLKYHYNYSFNCNEREFKYYLDLLLIDYDFLFENGKVNKTISKTWDLIIENDNTITADLDYNIEKNSTNSTDNLLVTINDKLELIEPVNRNKHECVTEFTLNKQIIAIHYLFKGLGCIKITKNEYLELFSLITKREITNIKLNQEYDFRKNLIQNGFNFNLNELNNVNLLFKECSFNYLQELLFSDLSEFYIDSLSNNDFKITFNEVSKSKIQNFDRIYFLYKILKKLKNNSYSNSNYKLTEKSTLKFIQLLTDIDKNMDNITKTNIYKKVKSLNDEKDTHLNPNYFKKCKPYFEILNLEISL